MKGEAKIVEFRLRNKRFDSPLPISDFYYQVQHYLFTIMDVQEALRIACRLFGSSSDIWQDQCERTIDSVQTIGEPIGQFYQLLLNTTQLPEDIIPFRYPLVISLHCMNEQVQNLIRLLTEFRAICRKASKQRSKQRQIIDGLLAEITQGCDEVQQKTYVLFDRVNQQKGYMAHANF